MMRKRKVCSCCKHLLAARVVCLALMVPTPVVDMAFGGAAGLGNLTYHTSNTEDPYIMINDDVGMPVDGV
jgi:hypothetical protein